MGVTAGTVVRVNGPVVEADVGGVVMGELVEVGDAGLAGEVIAIEGEVATLQVYEYTGGLAPGQRARATGQPLTAELGPGLIGGVFDGMLRRLAGAGDLLRPGRGQGAVAGDARWNFTPRVARRCGGHGRGHPRQRARDCRHHVPAAGPGRSVRRG